MLNHIELHFHSCWLHLGNRPAVRHPDIRSIKSHAVGVAAHGECSQVGAVRSSQLAHGAVAPVRHPDVGPIKGHILGITSHGECSQVGAVRGPQLSHRVAAIIRHPNIGSIKGHASRVLSREKRPHNRTVGGSQLEDKAVDKAITCNPDVSPIESEACCPAVVFSYTELIQYRAVASPQLGNIGSWMFTPCRHYPNISSIKDHATSHVVLHTTNDKRSQVSAVRSPQFC